MSSWEGERGGGGIEGGKEGKRKKTKDDELTIRQGKGGPGAPCPMNHMNADHCYHKIPESAESERENTDDQAKLAYCYSVH